MRPSIWEAAGNQEIKNNCQIWRLYLLDPLLLLLFSSSSVIYLFYVHVSGCAHATACARSENKQSAPNSWPYPSIMEVLGITLRPSGLVASTSTSWATSSVTPLVVLLSSSHWSPKGPEQSTNGWEKCPGDIDSWDSGCSRKALRRVHLLGLQLEPHVPQGGALLEHGTSESFF